MSKTAAFIVHAIAAALAFAALTALYFARFPAASSPTTTAAMATPAGDFA